MPKFSCELTFEAIVDAPDRETAARVFAENYRSTVEGDLAEEVDLYQVGDHETARFFVVEKMEESS